MHYLTVQDIIWINSLAMKSPQRFDYARLEEATYYQYAYGGSSDLAAQASRFLSGFRQKAPFEAGNEATGFVAFAAFLRANGKRLMDGAAGNLPSEPTPQAIAAAIGDARSDGHGMGIKDIIAQIFAEHAATIAGLTG